MCGTTANGSRNGIVVDRNNESNAKRNYENGRKVTECFLGISLPLWCTFKYQANEPNCRTSLLIVSTMVVYGILYALLRYYSGFLQPSLSSWQVAISKKKNPKTVSAAAADSASEWRSRILATGNALILIVGSILCFMEWIDTYVPESEGWVKTLPLQCETTTIDGSNNCSCFSSNPVTFASLFVGYLQWDLCWLIWHRTTHPDFASMTHHTIFIGVTHFVLSDTYFRKPFAWLSFTELSTPFLHARWFLAATGQKEHGSLYVWMSLGFALTFLLTRAVGYGLGLFDVWRNKSSWGGVSGLWGVVVGLHLSYGLNLFWSVKVGSALMRTVFGGSKGKKPLKPERK